MKLNEIEGFLPEKKEFRCGYYVIVDECNNKQQLVFVGEERSATKDYTLQDKIQTMINLGINQAIDQISTKDLPFKELDEGEVNAILEYYRDEGGDYDLDEAVKAICKKFVVKDQWISVEDRLPENNLFVLVFGKIKENIYATYMLSYRFTASSTKTNEWDCEFLKTYPFIVTHWQPLPEQPKETL